MNSKKQQLYKRRKARVRAKVSGTSERPRLCVSRSLLHLFVQVIDDVNGKTLLSAHSKEIDSKGKTRTQVASELGQLFAERAQKADIRSVVFDRGGRAYHGRVKAFAEGARSAGLTF